MSAAALQHEDVSMSCGILQRLNQTGAITIAQLADEWGIEPHSAYPYLTDREMRYGQTRSLYRHARDRRIQEAIHNDLMQGTGWSAVYIEADLDFDGDGDVDVDDVLGHAIGALDDLATYLKQVQQSGRDWDMAYLAQLKQRVLHGIVASERCAGHIAAMQSGHRRKARPVSIGGGR